LKNKILGAVVNLAAIIFSPVRQLADASPAQSYAPGFTGPPIGGFYPAAHRLYNKTVH